MHTYWANSKSVDCTPRWVRIISKGEVLPPRLQNTYLIFVVSFCENWRYFSLKQTKQIPFQKSFHPIVPLSHFTVYAMKLHRCYHLNYGAFHKWRHYFLAGEGGLGDLRSHKRGKKIIHRGQKWRNGGCWGQKVRKLVDVIYGRPLGSLSPSIRSDNESKKYMQTTHLKSALNCWNVKRKRKSQTRKCVIFTQFSATGEKIWSTCTHNNFICIIRQSPLLFRPEFQYEFLKNSSARHLLLLT